MVESITSKRKPISIGRAPDRPTSQNLSESLDGTCSQNATPRLPKALVYLCVFYLVTNPDEKATAVAHADGNQGLGKITW
jgi:hypothetical protein